LGGLALSVGGTTAMDPKYGVGSSPYKVAWTTPNPKDASQFFSLQWGGPIVPDEIGNITSAMKGSYEPIYSGGFFLHCKMASGEIVTLMSAWATAPPAMFFSSAISGQAGGDIPLKLRVWPFNIQTPTGSGIVWALNYQDSGVASLKSFVSATAVDKGSAPPSAADVSDDTYVFITSQPSGNDGSRPLILDASSGAVHLTPSIPQTAVDDFYGPIPDASSKYEPLDAGFTLATTLSEGFAVGEVGSSNLTYLQAEGVVPPSGGGGKHGGSKKSRTLYYVLGSVSLFLLVALGVYMWSRKTSSSS